MTWIQSINISEINKLNPLFCDLLIDLQRQTIKRPVSIASNVNFRFIDPISSLYSFDLFYFLYASYINKILAIKWIFVLLLIFFVLILPEHDTLWEQY